ncbi:MAG: DNA polymerase III subunit gamma/tau [Firmicutes bacterium HGW-Firmicutes-19]|nr:MAG: DNA polymerase III subunit gamma/tau [Firmicutes bacterium HGW-Firmicutes-19]
MAYKALYRTYRPTSFEKVVGQQHIVKTLQNAVLKHKIAHAYLFCGPRGTGKTTVAKLMAKAVNCPDTNKAPCNVCDSCLSIQAGTHPDIIEIDAASNNGVDEIRDLIEKVKYSPIEGKYKVYIIDEVHMLSQGAFNALLKTLEEPPSHVIFILATTEPHKVLPTIISRCQRFDFTKVPMAEIGTRVKEVLDLEKIKYEEGVIRLISQLAEGGLRDALSILEQCIAYAQNDLRVQHVHDIYGITTVSEKIDLLDAVFSKDVVAILDNVRFISEKSFDIKRLTSDMIDLLKECIIYQYTRDASLLQIATEDEVKHILAKRNANDLLKMIDIFIETMDKYRNATNIHSYFEVALLKMMSMGNETADYAIKKEAKMPFADSKPKADVAKEEKLPFIQPEEPVTEELITVIEEPIVLKSPNDERLMQLDIVSETSEATEVEELLLSDFDIVRFMVAGDKARRTNEAPLWNRLDDYINEIEWAKVARMISDGNIVVTNEQFVVLSVPYEEVAREINAKANEVALRKLMIEIVKQPRKVFAITKDQEERTIALFRELWSAGKLPEPMIIHVEPLPKVKKQDEEVSVDQRLVSLFGEGNVDFIHEE